MHKKYKNVFKIQQWARAELGLLAPKTNLNFCSSVDRQRMFPMFRLPKIKTVIA